jgi:hypothetical protein
MMKKKSRKINLFASQTRRTRPDRRDCCAALSNNYRVVAAATQPNAEISRESREEKKKKKGKKFFLFFFPLEGNVVCGGASGVWNVCWVGRAHLMQNVLATFCSDTGARERERREGKEGREKSGLWLGDDSLGFFDHVGLRRVTCTRKDSSPRQVSQILLFSSPQILCTFASMQRERCFIARDH